MSHCAHRLGQLGPLLILLLTLALNAAAEQAYLPVVGPPPLRFELPPPKAIAESLALPPLPVFNPPTLPEVGTAVPAAATTTNPLETVTSTANPGQETSSPTPEEWVPPFVLPMEPIPGMFATNAPAPVTPTVTPQMLLKFFSRPAGTNGAAVSIYAPVEFLPPVPVLPPSSSATFELTPAAKP